MRKTSTLPNGEKIDYKRVAELAYLEFASGRIERKSNAEQEIRNRIGPTVPLVYPTWKHEASLDTNVLYFYLSSIKSSLNM